MSVISIVSKIFDGCIITMLIYGDENMRTFGLCVAALMTAVAWLCLFGLKLETARIIHTTPLRRIVGTLINSAYAYALIVSGSPVWAAFYLLGFFAIRLNAAKIVNDAKLPAARS